MELVERVRPLFAGQDPAVVGAALADLTAIWLASHVVRGDPKETDALRGRLMLAHMQAVRALTAINAQQLGTDQ
jgi:hemerythrin